jgi:hypothetical protein
MPRPRIAMRKIREVLRLVLGEGLSRHQAAAATRVPYTTLADCLTWATGAGPKWPLPEGMDDRDLEERLYRRAALPPAAVARDAPGPADPVRLLFIWSPPG